MQICLYCEEPIDKAGRFDRIFCSPSHKTSYYRREAAKERFVARMSLRDGSFIRAHSRKYMIAMKQIERQLRAVRSVVKSQQLYWGYRLTEAGRSPLLTPAFYPLISPDETTRLNHLGKKVKSNYFSFYPAELPLVPVTGLYSLILVGTDGETDTALIRDQYKVSLGGALELPGCKAVPAHPSRKTK
jgi:hypothetical protein